MCVPGHPVRCTLVPNDVQNHANRPPKQSPRMRSASTALHQGSEVLFPESGHSCLNVSPALGFRSISEGTCILLQSHCRSPFPAFRHLDVPVTGLTMHVDAFDALWAPALLCDRHIVGNACHRCAKCTIPSIYQSPASQGCGATFTNQPTLSLA